MKPTPAQRLILWRLVSDGWGLGHSMADLMDDDYELLDQSIRVAVKAHKCSECGRIIERGESYENSRGLMDGRWYEHHTCAHCQAARGWLSDVCGGWLFEGVLEDLEHHWDDDVTYRYMGLGRLLIGMRRGWRIERGPRAGQLQPVPVVKVPRHLLSH
jgi:hypothetical protein